MLVGAGDELLIGKDEVGRGDGALGVPGFGDAADVVDGFEDDEVLDAALGEDVAVEAGDGVGTGAIVEQAIAADAFVEDANGCGVFGGVQALSEVVGPAAVGVDGGSVAVGDGVAEGYNGGGARIGDADVDSFEEAPGFGGARIAKFGGGGRIARGKVVGGCAKVVASGATAG